MQDELSGWEIGDGRWNRGIKDLVVGVGLWILRVSFVVSWTR